MMTVYPQTIMRRRLCGPKTTALLFLLGGMALSFAFFWLLARPKLSSLWFNHSDKIVQPTSEYWLALGLCFGVSIAIGYVLVSLCCVALPSQTSRAGRAIALLLAFAAVPAQLYLERYRAFFLGESDYVLFPRPFIYIGAAGTGLCIVFWAVARLVSRAVTTRLLGRAVLVIWTFFIPPGAFALVLTTSLWAMTGKWRTRFLLLVFLSPFVVIALSIRVLDLLPLPTMALPWPVVSPVVAAIYGYWLCSSPKDWAGWLWEALKPRRSDSAESLR